jgi:hypothetical protein
MDLLPHFVVALLIFLGKGLSAVVSTLVMDLFLVVVTLLLFLGGSVSPVSLVVGGIGARYYWRLEAWQDALQQEPYMYSAAQEGQARLRILQSRDRGISLLEVGYRSELQAAQARLLLAMAAHRRLSETSPFRWLHEGKLLADVGQRLRPEPVPAGAVLRMDGAGTAMCNGFYKRDGDYNGKPLYHKVNDEDVKISCYRNYSYRTCWNLGRIDDCGNDDYYCYKCQSSAKDPSCDGWVQASDGKGPAPQLSWL